MTYCIPDSHYLGWGDAHPNTGFILLCNLQLLLYLNQDRFNCLLKWISEETDYHTILKDYHLGYP